MIEQVTVYGYISENCFFYIDDESKHGFLIDPGAQADKLLAMIEENGWVIEGILITHGHFDHIGAVNEIRDALHIPVIAYETADPMPIFHPSSTMRSWSRMCSMSKKGMRLF